jgi:hypothetical protein
MGKIVMTDQRKPAQRYFEEGQEAHRQNTPQTSNPYEGGNREAADYWNQGWETEQKAAYGEG